MVMICDTWWILGIGGYTGYQFQICKDGTLWTSNPHLELDRIIRRSFKKKCHHLVCLCTYTNTNTYTYTYIYIHSICIYITYCVIHVYLYTSIWPHVPSKIFYWGKLASKRHPGASKPTPKDHASRRRHRRHWESSFCRIICAAYQPVPNVYI